MIAVFISTDQLARRVFLWDLDMIQRTKEFVSKMEQEKVQKQKIVGYLFHEGDTFA